MWPDLLLVPLVAAMLVASWQDYRRREVSNWITIPICLLGMIALSVRTWRAVLGADPDAVIYSTFLIVVVIVFTVLGLIGWMGGADYKLLVGLVGLWPLGGFAALIGAGIQGAIALIRKQEDTRIPAVVGMAIAVLLTILARLSIMRAFDICGMDWPQA